MEFMGFEHARIVHIVNNEAQCKREAELNIIEYYNILSSLENRSP